MARKSKSSAKPTATSSKTDLGVSELRLRLNFLEKENEKLLKQIEKNRTELNNLTESINDVGVQIAQRSAPLRQKLFDLDSQIHKIFKDIFTGRKLGKKSRKDIEEVYYHLQSDGIITPNHDFMDTQMFGADDFEDFEGFDDEPDWGKQQERSHQDIARDFPKPDRDELKKIRQLFLRLAESFHPDKVTDEAEKEYRTEVMKEINQAYQHGDLAKLLAIEKQQELGEIINRDSSDDLTRQCARVEAENTFLNDQLTNLKQQLRLTKKTPQGSITTQFKKMQKHGVDPIEVALSEVEAQIEIIEQLHKFITDFRDRRITIKEFLRGPTALMPQQDLSEEEMLLEFLSRFESRYK
jgi:hypothetical protein